MKRRTFLRWLAIIPFAPDVLASQETGLHSAIKAHARTNQSCRVADIENSQDFIEDLRIEGHMVGDDFLLVDGSPEYIYLGMPLAYVHLVDGTTKTVLLKYPE